MECTATCRICGVKISCKDGNLFSLGEHLLSNHPEIDINHYIMENCEGLGDSRTGTKGQKKNLNKCSLASSLLKKSSTFIKSRRRALGGDKKNLYKTTIESWRPGVNQLTCPKCGNAEQPYIRKQRNKVAYNSLGAFFLLGCWPLCFLPMLMSGGSNTIICCRKCGYCFGTYDKKKGKLIPSTKDFNVETPNLC
ncbi:uncharacterized protein LOC135128464 [Zophobas morio]|uniref:uncharacterized protein LOC135128464 n=1 Tax=Zophobas morio TaxID=2755281 RepID=UPI0030831E82